MDDASPMTDGRWIWFGLDAWIESSPDSKICNLRSKEPSQTVWAVQAVRASPAVLHDRHICFRHMIPEVSGRFFISRCLIHFHTPQDGRMQGAVE